MPQLFQCPQWLGAIKIRLDRWQGCRVRPPAETALGGRMKFVHLLGQGCPNFCVFCLLGLVSMLLAQLWDANLETPMSFLFGYVMVFLQGTVIYYPERNCTGLLSCHRFLRRFPRRPKTTLGYQSRLICVGFRIIST